MAAAVAPSRRAERFAPVPWAEAAAVLAAVMMARPGINAKKRVTTRAAARGSGDFLDAELEKPAANRPAAPAEAA